MADILTQIQDELDMVTFLFIISLDHWLTVFLF